MKVLISGSSGLIGSALLPALSRGGHSVARLVRPGTKPSAGEIVWDPDAGRIDLGSIEGFDAVVHLAGENVAGGRWTDAYQARIRESRLRGTSLLAGSLAKLSRPPQVMVCASAVGYYGDRVDELLTEASPPGAGFLPEVCREWEGATGIAARQGIRVVNLRFGMVLGASGGALAKMLPPFKLGLGGPLGSGRQYVSWITLDDVIAIIHEALRAESWSGPVNTVAPQAVTNREFTKTLGRVLRRPTIFAVPAFVLRLTFGELADALLLASARVSPARLEAAGYHFLYPDLEGALRHALGLTGR